MRQHREDDGKRKSEWIEVSISIRGGTHEQRDELAGTIGHQARTAAKKRGLVVDFAVNADEGYL